MKKRRCSVMCNEACCIKDRKLTRRMHTIVCLNLRQQERWQYLSQMSKESKQPDEYLSLQPQHRWSNLSGKKHVLFKVRLLCVYVQAAATHAFAQAADFCRHDALMHTIKNWGRQCACMRLGDSESIVLAFHTSLSIFPPKSLHTCFYIQC